MTRTPPAFLLFMLFMVLLGLLFTAGCTGALPSGGNSHCILPAMNLSCRPDQISCLGSCISTLTDINNCGGCSQACKAREVCRDGECVISAAAKGP